MRGKRTLYTVIALLLIVLGIGYFSENKPKASSNAKTVKIGVLTLMHHPSLDQIYKGYIDGLKKAGYVRGKNLKMDYQNANNDQSNLKTMAGKLVNEKSDVIFSITTPSSQAVANSTKHIPIVLGAVTDPKGANLVKNMKHPGGNITGVSDKAPIENQLKLIKRFMPKLKTLGLIYTSSDSSAVSGAQEIQSLSKKMGIKIAKYTISNSNDLNQVSQQMMSKVDAVIVPTDNTIAGAMSTLVKNANAAKKPVFPAVQSMVKEGGVATYGVSQRELGEIGAKMTVKILKGEDPGSMAISYVKHGTPILNLKQAKKLGLKVPSSFLKEAEDKGVVYR